MNRPFGLPANAPTKAFERSFDRGWLPRGYIDGLVLSNDTDDATNDIDVAAGVARSTVNIVDGEASTLARDQIDLEIPVAITKQLDVAFAPTNYDGADRDGGARSGMLSSSSISNTTWHVYCVGRRGEPSEILAHDSATQANVLAEMQKVGGYTAYRHIMSVCRVSATIKPFTQINDDVLWTTPTLDVNDSATGTGAKSGTLTVPTGIKLPVTLMVGNQSASNLYISSLDQTDSAADYTAAPGALRAGAAVYGMQFRTITNTSAQIRYRTDSNSTVGIITSGFRHPRGRDA